MSQDKKKFPPGFWRDSGRELTWFGMPVWLFLFYLFWFRFPSFMTIYIVSGILIFFRVLAAFGWSVTELLTRLARRLRGLTLSGRPWWYRRFHDGE